MTPPGTTAAAVTWLVRPRGDRRWDWFLRGTVVAGIVGVVVALALPATIPLVWLTVLGIPANSPLSPVLPTAFEPLIIEAAKFASPLVVSFTALGVYMYTEYVNWHLYAWVLHGERAGWLRRQPWVERSVDYFARAPFVSVVVFAFTPLPFWAARGLAILRGYSLRSFLLATVIGRWPRFFLYAWLGHALHVPTLVLVLVIVAGGATVFATRLARGQEVLAETVLDASAAEAGEAD
jgi:uncharacterized membrane protein YdjX (TVP38/TMEM64 family)